MDEKTIRQWREERDATVASLDVVKFRTFCEKWRKCGIYSEDPPSDRILEIAMYKMACNIEGIPQATKDTAREWLFSRGYSEVL